MNQAKKHHFVPKSYLRFFAQEKNQDKYQIYDKNADLLLLISF